VASGEEEVTALPLTSSPSTCTRIAHSSQKVETGQSALRFAATSISKQARALEACYSEKLVKQKSALKPIRSHHVCYGRNGIFSMRQKITSLMMHNRHL